MLEYSQGVWLKMKKTYETYSGKAKRYRKHPIGRRLMVGLLCVCMMTVSLPVEHFGYIAWAAQKQEIVSEPELSREIREQSVPLGTDLQELDLPGTLTAVCRPLEDAPQVQPQETVEPKAEPESVEIQNAQAAKTMINTGTEEGTESAPSEEGTEPAPSQEGSEPAPSEEPSEPAPPENGGETAPSDNIPAPGGRRM